MHVSINVKSPNNINEWQMGFNSEFKGLTTKLTKDISDNHANDFTKKLKHQPPTEKNSCLPGYNVTPTGKHLPTFRKKLVLADTT